MSRERVHPGGPDADSPDAPAIVLVVPRLLDADPAGFAAMAAEAPGGRCIVRADTAEELGYARLAAEAKLHVEVLSCTLRASPEDALAIVRMLPGATCADADLLGLAFCDAVLARSAAEAKAFCEGLKWSPGHVLTKPHVETLEVQPAPLQAADARFWRLDPKAERSVAGAFLVRTLDLTIGRIDEALIGFFAVCGRAFARLSAPQHQAGCRLLPDDSGAAPAGDEPPVRDPDPPVGRWQAYFAPPTWPLCTPDRKFPSVHDLPLMRGFRRLDRAATFGARVQRGIVWIAHAAAAFAVFAAVASILHLGHFAGWAGAELALILLALIPVLIARCRRLQPRWLACRLAAEQIRIGYTCLAVMLPPPVLLLPDAADDARPLRREAVATAKRLLRDHGLPRIADSNDLEAAIRWTRLIVRGQFKYHHDNHVRLEPAEAGINGWTLILSALVLAAVLGHVGGLHHPSLALVSAFFPALAAALHGIGNRLGLATRSDLSGDAAETLRRIDGELQRLNPAGASSKVGEQLRDLTWRAGEAMSAETEQWHRLALLQPLPATV